MITWKIWDAQNELQDLVKPYSHCRQNIAKDPWAVALGGVKLCGTEGHSYISERKMFSVGWSSWGGLFGGGRMRVSPWMIRFKGLFKNVKHFHVCLHGNCCIFSFSCLWKIEWTKSGASSWLIYIYICNAYFLFCLQPSLGHVDLRAQECHGSLVWTVALGEAVEQTLVNTCVNGDGYLLKISWGWLF